MKYRISQRGKVQPLYDHLPTDCGIYRLYVPAHELSYIGQSRGLRHRLRMHLNDLGKGTHYAPKLQLAFDDVGYDGLQWEILEHFPADTPRDAPELLDAEAAWTSKMRNCSTVATRWRANVFAAGRHGAARASKQGADAWDDPVKVKAQVEHWTARFRELEA